MHRTEEDGATLDNKYTEGNAATSIPATVVGSVPMNAIQEEISGVIEEAGIPLLTKTTDTFDQLKTAIPILVQNGGAILPIVNLIANNQATPAVLQDTGVDIEFDRAVIYAAEFRFFIQRNTDTDAFKESGKIMVSYEPKNQAWDIAHDSSFDDSGVTFSLAAGSTPDKVKLQYVSDQVPGTSYFGELRLSHYKEIRK